MKLISLNTGIKIDNTDALTDFLEREDADIVCLQEVSGAIETSAKDMFQVKEGIDAKLSETYPYRFFGKVWKSRGFNRGDETRKNKLDFGGLIEQGNYILSKYPFSHEVLNEGFKKQFWKFDYRDKLDKITAKCHFIVGEKDWINDPKLIKQIADQVRKSNLIVIPDCGHSVSIDKPELYKQLLKKIFTKVSRGLCNQ